MWKTWKDTDMTADESQKKKEVIAEARNETQQFFFCR